MGNKAGKKKRKESNDRVTRVSSSSIPSVSTRFSEIEITLDTNTPAATKIQGVWKSHQARNERLNLTHWKIFNDLENREEADIYELSEFLQAVQEYMPLEEVNKEMPQQDTLSKQLSLAAVDIDISEMYHGIILNNPITQKNVDDMMDSFKRGQLLHKKYVHQILLSAISVLQMMPNVKHVKIQKPAIHITIVGDLHGQLDDLLLIFRENGVPSNTNPYVFNGDFVDRGKNAVEVTCLIYGYMLLYPEHVHINRGNHEDASVTTVFGFMKEVQSKYDMYTFHAFAESFRWLPMATVIEKRVIVLHGGLPKADISLDDLQDIPRWDYTLARPSVRAKTKEEKKMNMYIDLMRDILWSDPQTKPGCKKSKRGAGVLYGPDIAERFLLKNDLQLLVRSHECVPKGFNWPYGARGMVVTLFSASNYCGRANNLGAFMHVPVDQSANPSFFQYMASNGERDMVVKNLNAVFSLILEHREELILAFRKNDIEKKGVISIAMWSSIMSSVLQLDLQWVSIQPLLAQLTEDKLIWYQEFLDRYVVSVASGGNNEDEQDEKHMQRRDLFNSLYRHRTRLEALFRVFDQNGDGVISKEEFREGITLLNQHLPAGTHAFTHVDELLRILDFSGDNAIDVNEFMECFRLNVRLTVHAKWRRAKVKLRAIASLKKMGTTKRTAEPVRSATKAK